MLVSPEDCLADLRCPVTKSRLTREDSRLFTSGSSADPAHEYQIIDGKPVLVNFDRSVVRKDAIASTGAASEVARTTYSGPARFVKKLLSPERKATRDNVAKLKKSLSDLPRPARLLIVGGGSIGGAMAPLYDDPQIKVYSFDIYTSPYVQFVADAHEMPLPDDFFDAVIIQAVLEHVLQPAEVVAEIWRVLKPGGLVYAETPFMQQVHEGAYDFTRFTDSGHRFLFRQFDLIDSGPCGGPGLQLMWSADYFARGLFRSRTAGKLAKTAMFWAQYLDRLIPSDYAIDGASGVYFLGSKSSATMSASDVIDYYKGAN